MIDPVKVGRLAMRVEGHWWVAYFAAPDTMDKAVEMGRIAMGVVTRNQEHKEAFMTLMRGALDDFLELKLGVRPERWGDPEAAPESERSGSA